MILSTVSLTACPVLTIFAANYVVQCSPGAAEAMGISEEGIGLVILPLIGNMPTLREALLLASRNRMDHAVQLTLGTSVDIAYITLPMSILIAGILKQPMTMGFSVFNLVELFTSTLLTGRIIGRGSTTYLDGLSSLTM